MNTTFQTICYKGGVIQIAASGNNLLRVEAYYQAMRIGRFQSVIGAKRAITKALDYSVRFQQNV